MSDPNLPEDVTQRDIDKTVGETFDPNLDEEECKHGAVVCEICAVEKMETKVKKLQTRLENIKTLCGYLDGCHPPTCQGSPTCQGWDTKNYRIVFERYNCNCIIFDILHEIEMTKD